MPESRGIKKGASGQRKWRLDPGDPESGGHRRVRRNQLHRIFSSHNR